MRGEVAESSRQVVARYFQMWNTGDTSIAMEVLGPDWLDDAHPEVSSPCGVQRAAEMWTYQATATAAARHGLT